jgi:cytochrome c biogenesis protein CcmG/thiol:disulfide interchange protein DsbE
VSTEPLADAADPARRGRLRYAGRIGAIVIAGLFLGLLAYGVLSRPQDTTIDDRLAESRTAPAPAFDLPILERGALGPALTRRLAPALADGRVSLKDLRGVPVVLNFWASWCVPCRDEAAALERGWQRARPQGVAYVGLNMQDLSEDARAFAGEVGMDYLTIRDRSNGVARSYGVTGIPETFFIDRAGRVVGHVVGAITPAQLTAGTAAAQRGRPIGVQAGGNRRETR